MRGDTLTDVLRARSIALVVVSAACAAACQADDADATPDSGSDAAPDSGSEVSDTPGATVTSVWVDPAAAQGGDGSAGAPFVSLDAAFASGLPDDVEVRLVAGEHPIGAVLDVPIRARVIGAGPGATRLVGDVATLVVRDALALESVSLTVALNVQGAVLSLAAVGLDPGATLHVTTEQAVVVALDADAAGVTFDGLASLDVSGLTSRGSSLEVRDCGEADLIALTFEDVFGDALRIVDTVAVVRDVAVEDVLATEEARGDAVVVVGGRVELDDVRVTRSAGRGLNVLDDAAVVAADLNVAGAGDAAVGISGGSLRLDTPALRAAVVGVVANDADVSLVGGRIEEMAAHCVLASGGDLTVAGTYVATCGETGVSAAGYGALDIANTTIDATGAPCVSASDAAGTTRVALSTFSRCSGAGVGLLNVQDAVLDGVEVHTVAPDPLFGTVEGIAAVDASGAARNLNLHDIDGVGLSLLRSAFVVESSGFVRLGDAGVRAVGVAADPTVVRGCTVDEASGAGVFVSEGRATIESNVITHTRMLASEGLGEGVVFGLGAAVDVLGNTIEQSAASGVTFFSGASGSIDRNRLAGNRGRGVQEYCIDASPSPVVVGPGNTFAENGLGDVERCSP